MTNDNNNLRDTIIPKSDQLNADDLIAGPITVRITSVKRGDSEQPICIGLDGQRPYKPCKSMRRVLISAWGDDGAQWVGRSMTLYQDPEVKFGGVKVGGIRISHLSDIKSDMSMSLTATRGKRAQYVVSKLVKLAYPVADFEKNLPAWHTAIDEGKSSPEKIIAKVQEKGELTADQRNRILRKKTWAEAFDSTPSETTENTSFSNETSNNDEVF